MRFFSSTSPSRLLMTAGICVAASLTAPAAYAAGADYEVALRDATAIYRINPAGAYGGYGQTVLKLMQWAYADGDATQRDALVSRLVSLWKTPPQQVPSRARYVANLIPQSWNMSFLPQDAQANLGADLSQYPALKGKVIYLLADAEHTQAKTATDFYVVADPGATVKDTRVVLFSLMQGHSAFKPPSGETAYVGWVKDVKYVQTTYGPTLALRSELMFTSGTDGLAFDPANARTMARAILEKVTLQAKTPATVSAELARVTQDRRTAMGSWLLASAKAADLRNAELALAAGADPDARTEDGETALILAAREGEAAISRAILAKGARPDLQNTRGETALHAAAEGGHLDVIKALVAKKANPNLQSKALISGVYSGPSNPSGGETALMIAAREGYFEAVRFMLQNGADPNMRNLKGDTALLAAAARQQLPTLKVLLEKGARVDDANAAGTTPLMVVVTLPINSTPAETTVYNLAEALVKAGADVKRKNAQGRSATDLVKANYNTTKKVRVLITGGQSEVLK